MRQQVEDREAMAIPKRAVMIGSPMATTDPKANSMMTMAARMPIPSLDPGRPAATRPMAGPPSDTLVARVRRTSRRRAMTCLMAPCRQVAGLLVEG